MKTVIDRDLRQYCSISIRYGLVYSIVFLYFLILPFSGWVKKNDNNIFFSRDIFSAPNIEKYLIFFPMILFGYFLFVGIREIVASPKRYRRLTWVLKNISPTNVLIKIQISPGSRGSTYYIVDVYSDRATANSQACDRFDIMAPTWNVHSLLDRLIPAKAYLDPTPKSGIIFRIKDKTLVYLPRSIHTFTLF